MHKKKSSEKSQIPVIPFDPVSLSIWAIGYLIGLTWKVSIENQSTFDPYADTGKNCIYCFWHSNLLPMTFIFRNTNKTAVVSKSSDGIRAAAAAQRWGHRIIFGSSSRGGASALRQCIRALADKERLVITPDGPRGPKEIVKPGIAQIAVASKSPVVCLKSFASRFWKLKSWDGFIIPKPFSKIKVIMTEPLYPQLNEISEESVELFRKSIQERLDSIG